MEFMKVIKKGIGNVMYQNKGLYKNLLRFHKISLKITINLWVVYGIKLKVLPSRAQCCKFELKRCTLTEMAAF